MTADDVASTIVLVFLLAVVMLPAACVGQNNGKRQMWDDIARQRCAEQGMDAVIDAGQWRYACVPKEDLDGDR